jgi:hypothetical protein
LDPFFVWVLYVFGAQTGALGSSSPARLSPVSPSLGTTELSAPTPCVALPEGTPAHGRAGQSAGAAESEVVAGGSGKKKTIKLADREVLILLALAEFHEAVPGIAQ